MASKRTSMISCLSSSEAYIMKTLSNVIVLHVLYDQNVYKLQQIMLNHWTFIYQEIALSLEQLGPNEVYNIGAGIKRLGGSSRVRLTHVNINTDWRKQVYFNWHIPFCVWLPTKTTFSKYEYIRECWRVRATRAPWILKHYNVLTLSLQATISKARGAC